jgi:hypothetical protein
MPGGVSDIVQSTAAKVVVSAYRMKPTAETACREDASVRRAPPRAVARSSMRGPARRKIHDRAPVEEGEFKYQCWPAASPMHRRRRVAHPRQQFRGRKQQRQASSAVRGNRRSAACKNGRGSYPSRRRSGCARPPRRGCPATGRARTARRTDTRAARLAALAARRRAAARAAQRSEQAPVAQAPRHGPERRHHGFSPSSACCSAGGTSSMPACWLRCKARR